MKKLIVFISFILCVPIKSVAQQDTFDLTVLISGMQTNTGKVFIAVYDSEASFLKNSKMTTSGTAIISDNEARITFENLKQGEYAVSVFHDENGNNKMDTKLFGIPKEPYGFSNNSKGFMGPPKFEDSKFSLNKNKSITIRIK